MGLKCAGQDTDLRHSVAAMVYMETERWIRERGAPKFLLEWYAAGPWSICLRNVSKRCARERVGADIVWFEIMHTFLSLSWSIRLRLWAST